MLGCMMRPPGTPVSWSEAASSTDSPKSEAHSRQIDVAADRRPERGQVITAFRFSSDQREAKGRRLMYVLQTRMLHRQRGSAGWPVATVLSDRLHRPAHRKAASNPRRLSVLRAEQAAALRRHRKAERPRSLSERLRLAGTPRPARECDTPCAAEDAEMLREGEDADDRSVTDKVSNAQMPTNGVGADQMPSFEDVSQFEGEMARDGGLADGADDLGGSEDDKQVNCCRCGVVLDRSDGVTIRPAIGDCDAAGCGHWACVPCSGVAEGYMGPWYCGCSRCGTSVQRSSRPGGCAGVASAAPAPSLPVTLLVKSSPPVARSPGQSAPPNAARAPSCDTSGTRRDLLIRPLPAGDATLAWGGGRAAAESDSDDEPGDHIPLSQRKRPLAPMARAAPAAVKPKADAKGVVAPAASGAKRQGSGERMAGTPGGSIRRKKVPRVRLKLNGKIEMGDGLAVLLGGKLESERGARDGSIGAAQSAMLVAGTTADALAALSSAGGGALDGAPCGDEGAAGSSSDLDSTREAPGDGSLSTLLTLDEAASACARTLGARLIDRYRRRKARSSEARKLTMHSMVAPTWLDPTASATDVVGSSTVASRGSRREHRQLASILGLNSAKKGGDSAVSALIFNDLTSRKKKVRLAKSAIHSWGLYAAEPIDADDFVVEYIGEYVRASVAELRERKYRRLGYGDDYIFRVDADTLVDATRMGGVARFANHCCDPNCYTTIIKAGGKPRVVLYSKRVIEPGEEITYNYNFDVDEDESLRIRCHCGAKACKGYLN